MRHRSRSNARSNSSKLSAATRVTLAISVGLICSGYLTYSIVGELYSSADVEKVTTREVEPGQRNQISNVNPLPQHLKRTLGIAAVVEEAEADNSQYENEGLWEETDSAVPEQQIVEYVDNGEAAGNSYNPDYPTAYSDSIGDTGTVPYQTERAIPQYNSNVQQVTYAAPFQQTGTPAPGTAGTPPGAPPSPVPTPAPTPAPEELGKGTYLKELGAWLGETVTPVLEGGVYAGVDFNLLSTETAGSGALRFTDLNTNKFSGADSESEFGSGIRWTAGLHHQVVGFRARYFDFREESLDIGAYLPNSDWPRLESSQRLDLTALDIELTQEYTLLGSCLESSFGVRHANLEGTNSILGIGTLGDRLEVHGSSYIFRSVEAIGPTFAIGGRGALPWGFGACPPVAGHACGDAICNCGSGWSWFWSLRGSLLWGDTLAKASTEAQTYIKSDGAIQAVSRSSDSAYANTEAEAKLFHSEVLLGLEYRHQMRIIPSTLRFRTALEYQGWDTGSAFATSKSYAFLGSAEPRFGGRVDSLAVADNRHFNLFGINLSVTLNY